MKNENLFGIVYCVHDNIVIILGNDGKNYRYKNLGSFRYFIGSRVVFKETANNKISRPMVCTNRGDTGRIIRLSDKNGYIMTEQGEIFLFEKSKFSFSVIGQKVNFDIRLTQAKESFAFAVNIKPVHNKVIDISIKDRVYNHLKFNFEFDKPYNIAGIMQCLKEINIYAEDFGYSDDILFLEAFSDFLHFEYPSNRVILFDRNIIPEQYEKASDILKKAGYNKMTSLQQYTFRDKSFWERRKIIIMGSTSSGKTIIPIVRFFYDYQNRTDNKNCKMLFVVNLRALASQTKKSMEAFFGAFDISNEDMDISVSTSEHISDDERIKRGRTDIAIIMYEKLFIFLATDPEILDKYDYIVLDEVGTVENDERGAKIDIVFSHICKHKNINAVFLANTYNNWQKYIVNYGIYPIRYYSRPIHINEFFFYRRQCKR